ncbi:TonB-dependent receptor [Telluria mixta]|uniref:TonB-dependent receptor n=1 Tax=Telluria mixta TaxID=34071 RepID=A0ABT2BYK7_9BURK|nr:TonB-dependent receptor [Telluria mixta]MCS0630224.1 TonB-dependent receptor [Telluria mixta]WEM94468.1 TonB-dependent receptor [Telluria mixta]
MNPNHPGRRTVLAGCALMLPAAAFAQNATQAGIQEVIVTANRVETSAQKTSVALTIYTGDQLADKGVASVNALALIDPSVNVTTSTGAAWVAIRGVASTDTTQIGDPSVPIARDGFYTNRSYTIQSSMYDLARVEVLKGPQGTLNGRNSTGGLVSIITNRPEFKSNAGQVNAEVGNYNAFIVDGAYNIALSDTAALRFSGMHRKHRGYREVTGIDERGDDEDINSGRVQVAFKPTPALNLWLSYQHDDIDDVGDVALNTSAIGDRPASFGDARSFPGQASTYTRLKDDRVRWEARLDSLPGGLSLVYAGGRDEVDYHHALDATGTLYPATGQFLVNEHPVTWNHEVRVSNSIKSRLFFQGGLFYYSEDNGIQNGLLNLEMTGPFAPGGPLAALGTAGRYGVYFDHNIKTTSKAVFGQAAYALADALKLSVGLRKTWDTKDRTGLNRTDVQAVGSPFAPATILTSSAQGRYSEAEPTYHIGLDYTPTPTTLLYAKHDRGYKSGGFNSNGTGPSVPYAPEKLSAYEIGTKNRFMANRLQFNAAAFSFDYRGYQASQFSSALGGGAGIFNVGNAKIHGAEAQLLTLFGDGGRIDVNGTWLRTKFGNGIVVNDGGGSPHDISGKRLPNAPTLSVSAGLEYGWDVSGGRITPRLDVKYTSDYYFSAFNNPDEISKAYVTGNATLTYEPNAGHWQIQAFIRNLADKVVLANGVQNYLSGVNSYQFQPPRTFGLRGTYRF